MFSRAFAAISAVFSLLSRAFGVISAVFSPFSRAFSLFSRVLRLLSHEIGPKTVENDPFPSVPAVRFSIFCSKLDRRGVRLELAGRPSALRVQLRLFAGLI